MANVNLQQSQAIRAIERQHYWHQPAWMIVRWLVRLLGLGSVVIILTDFLVNSGLPSILIAGSCIGLGVSLLYLIVDLYLRYHWSQLPTLPDLPKVLAAQPPPNLADFLTERAAGYVQKVQSLIDQTPGKVFDPRLMLLAAFSTSLDQILARVGLVMDSTEALSQAHNLSQPGGDQSVQDLTHIFELAAEQVLQDQRSKIDDTDLLVSALTLDSQAAKIFFTMKTSLDDLKAAIAWRARLETRSHQLPWYDQPVGAGIAQDWTAGYTPYLARFVTDFTKSVRGLPAGLGLYGREPELKSLEQSLAKQNGHNVLVVGPAGVGKTALILGLTEQLTKGSVVSGIRYERVLALDVNAVVSGLSDRGELEERILRIFHEAAVAGNIILVIENIHQLVGGGDRVGGVDATELLLSVLGSPALRVIATTTPEDFQSRLSSNPALVGLFDRLDLGEPSPATMLEILEDAALGSEQQYHVFFTIAALRSIVQVADRYVHDQVFPGKGLILLNDVGSFAQQHKQTVILGDLVTQALSEKLKVPLTAATGAERDQLLHLETELHKTVVGQDEAISAIADALRRARAGLNSGKRPIASFLFLGPTGVGKTESAKALARVYFGVEKRMIRFDMTEYQQADSLVRIVGAPSSASGVKVGGLLADAVHDQPFSLVLLDELEKAHPQVLNLFLQVLDDGHLTDGTGRVIDFTNAIIIATSNAGAELIRESIAANEGQETRRTKLLNYLQQEGLYRPEFLNRFDGIIAFRPLEPAQIRQIVGLMLTQLAQQLAAEQELTVTFSDDLIDALATVGFDPEFGARPIRRVIQDKVETWLSQQILEGRLARGQTATLTAAMLGLGENSGQVSVSLSDL